MSRFFRQAGDSDSDTEESEEELMSSEDEAPKPAAAATKPAGMSRFLKGAGSDSSSDSDSDSDESDDSDQEDKATKRKNRFLKGDGDADEDSDDDDVKRVVKSAKDKRLDEMESTGKTIENALKINDWVAILNGERHLSHSTYQSFRGANFVTQNLRSWCEWLSGKQTSRKKFPAFSSSHLPILRPL